VGFVVVVVVKLALWRSMIFKTVPHFAWCGSLYGQVAE